MDSEGPAQSLSRSGRLVAGDIAWGLKRVIDIGLSLLLLLLSSPILIGSALLIWLLDRHHPFYVEDRVGRSGWTFKCLKLRTLRPDQSLLVRYLSRTPAEAARYRESRKLDDDPRKTRLGTFLRRHSVDEIPQLVNVLFGQMSIVGPRPLAPAEWRARGSAALDLLLVKPGLTGLWQVSGRSDLTPEQRIAYDCRYARAWSLGLDLLILLKTPLVIVAGRGAR